MTKSPVDSAREKSPIEQARKAAFVLDREHAQFQLARAVNDLIAYAESLERNDWKQLALAKLGGIRDSMPPEDVAVIQRFLDAGE